MVEGGQAVTGVEGGVVVEVAGEEEEIGGVIVGEVVVGVEVEVAMLGTMTADKTDAKPHKPHGSKKKKETRGTNGRGE